VSFSRENITWKSPADGKWYMGMFATTWVGSESDGYDPEWDVEYDFSRFSWVSRGHDNNESPRRDWMGANPGGGIICDADDKDAADFDRMAEEWRERDAKERAELRRQGVRWL
jgi:hypothetical protein